MKNPETGLFRVQELNAAALQGDRSPCLVVLTGVQAGQTHSLQEGICIIGRGRAATFLVDGEGISRRHIEITVS